MKRDYNIDKSRPIEIKLKPGSRSTQVVYNQENEFIIKIREKPVDGSANKAMIELLAKILNIPKSKIRLIKGQKSKTKVVIIDD